MSDEVDQKVNRVLASMGLAPSYARRFTPSQKQLIGELAIGDRLADGFRERFAEIAAQPQTQPNADSTAAPDTSLLEE